MKRLVATLLFAVSVLTAAPAYAFGQNKIVYDKFHWSVYHSTHFDVYFYDEEKTSLQKVVDNAESAYDDLSRKFNYQVTKKIPLIFYATHSAFEQTNVDLNFIPEAYGAFAEPVRNRMVLPIDTTDEKLLQLVTHELTHVFEYEILFQGKLGKTITANPPQWLMEGLASFMAQDEDSKDRMVLRDAVVNDQVPEITRNPQGYFAYRFGHAVFTFMQQKYGFEGVRDFVYEYRNTLGSSVDKALKRAFDVTPEEFDTKFRTWLRKQYLPALIAKGEPQEYGDPFKAGPDLRSDEIAPAVSPSGDLLASFTTYKEDVDLALFNIPERKILKNLSPGYTSRYEYFIAQSFTVGPTMGRDIGFAPNGDQVAVFAKKERGRNLLLINAITGTLQKAVPMRIEQQLNPTYAPDGRTIAFSGFMGNQSDIFFYDVASGDVRNVTADRFFDAAPVFSLDGKWLIYSSVVGGYAKLFRLNVLNPQERYQLTSGSWNDIDASFSPDGKRIFFASDRQTGRNVEKAVDILESAEEKARHQDVPKSDPVNYAAYNIYSLNLDSGDVLQYTDVVGGCFTPVVFTGRNNKERMVFASYYKRGWRLFSSTTDKPLHAAEKTTLSSAPLQASSRSVFQPPVEVSIDPEKIEETRGRKLFIDDVEVNAGVSSDQLFVSRSVIFMSDMLGDRRFIAALDSVSSFSNFDFLYFDLHKRLNWGIRVYDNRSFFTSQTDTSRNFNQRVKQTYRETGALGLLSYPFTRYHRIDFGAGFQSRQIAYPFITLVNDQPQLAFAERRDNFPLLTTTFSSDNALFRQYGPISGHRYDIGYTIAPDIKGHGILTADVDIDARKYFMLSSRTSIAARLFTGYSTGNFPNFYYFGGLNTVRGYDFRSIIGSKAAFANLEFRFPLIDVLATPIIVFQQVRGNLFFDVGGAAFKGQPFRFRENGLLKDGVASVGYGLSFNFLGLEVHWDFARRFNGKHTVGPVKADFWIGQTF